MDTKTIDLTPELRTELDQASAAISNQSILVGKALLSLREAESGLNTLYVHQRDIYTKALKSVGIKPEAVAKLFVDPDGVHLTVLLKPTNQDTPAPVPAPTS